MRNVHDFWIYVYYYTCTYKRKVYTVWTVNDVLGRIRIHIPWIDINTYLFGYVSLKNGSYILIFISGKTISLISIYTTQNVIDSPQYMLYTTDYGPPVRKSPSPHGRKSTPTPKFFGSAKAYFVCHMHRSKFSDFFDCCLHWKSIVRVMYHSTKRNFLTHSLLLRNLS